jgi:hypothetical protein
MEEKVEIVLQEGLAVSKDLEDLLSYLFQVAPVQLLLAVTEIQVTSLVVELAEVAGVP